MMDRIVVVFGAEFVAEDLQLVRHRADSGVVGLHQEPEFLHYIAQLGKIGARGERGTRLLQHQGVVFLIHVVSSL